MVGLGPRYARSLDIASFFLVPCEPLCSQVCHESGQFVDCCPGYP